MEEKPTSKETQPPEMDVQGGSRLDYLACHLRNGPGYARNPF